MSVLVEKIATAYDFVPYSNALYDVNLGSKDLTTSGYIRADGGIVCQGDVAEFEIPTGAGTRLMWIPSKKLFLAGDVDGTQWDEIGDYTFGVGKNFSSTGEGNFVHVINDEEGDVVISGDYNFVSGSLLGPDNLYVYGRGTSVICFLNGYGEAYTDMTVDVVGGSIFGEYQTEGTGDIYANFFGSGNYVGGRYYDGGDGGTSVIISGDGNLIHVRNHNSLVETYGFGGVVLGSYTDDASATIGSAAQGNLIAGCGVLGGTFTVDAGALGCGILGHATGGETMEVYGAGSWVIGQDLQALDWNIICIGEHFSCDAPHSVNLGIDGIVLQITDGLADFQDSDVTTTGIITGGTLVVDDEYTLPSTDGAEDQILQTDGAGTVSWVDPPEGGGGSGSSILNYSLFR